jgi:hypothetical protein
MIESLVQQSYARVKCGTANTELTMGPSGRV